MNAGFMLRLQALVRKETRQMLRDMTSLAVGLLLPVMLILLFGYGMSFDVKHAPIAVVMEDNSPQAHSVMQGFNGSSWIAPVWTTGMAEAEALMKSREVGAIVRVPSDFSARLAAGDAAVQLLLNGVETNTASAIESYVQGVVTSWTEKRIDRVGSAATSGAQVELVQRVWFNETNESSWFLVPGILVLVLTLLGAFLTAMLIAREWERGTLESLFVTPVRPLEIVLAKLVPYMVVGVIDLVVCVAVAHFLFDLPIRGSLLVMFLSGSLYLCVSLLLGLFISGRTRSQFLASQVSLVFSFLPSMMLSGFVFDLRNVPVVVQGIAQLLPATHFMGLVKSLFLMGNHWPTIVRDMSILAVYVVVLLVATTRTVKKTLD